MPDPETAPEPRFITAEEKSALDSLYSAPGLNLAVIQATAARVLAGDLKPDAALSFARTLVPQPSPDAVAAHVAAQLSDPAFEGFRAAPAAPPAPPAPPPPSWDSAYGGMGLVPLRPQQPQAQQGEPPATGSVEALAAGMRARAAQQHAAMAQVGRDLAIRNATHEARAHEIAPFPVAQVAQRAAAHASPVLTSHTLPGAPRPAGWIQPQPKAAASQGFGLTGTRIPINNRGKV